MRAGAWSGNACRTPRQHPFRGKIAPTLSKFHKQSPHNAHIQVHSTHGSEKSAESCTCGKKWVSTTVSPAAATPQRWTLDLKLCTCVEYNTKHTFPQITVQKSVRKRVKFGCEVGTAGISQSDKSVCTVLSRRAYWRLARATEAVWCVQTGTIR